jgi:biofilm PGA synthesis N-glycosyltransferase PgaC
MIYIIFAIGYYLIFLMLLFGLLRTQKKDGLFIEKKVSIIICARNESTKIVPLLQSLEKIDYSKEDYEVLLVNDDSSDDTKKIMVDFCEKKSNWKYLLHQKDKNSYKGKKGALDFGIQNSQYEIILATDADCVVQEKWVESMVSYFDSETAMVQGYSPVNQQPDFLSIYQQFDTLAEGVTAASSMYFNNPTHANARNFAFRRSVYDEVGGYSKISHVDTGDDFYLAKLIKNETDYRFRYNPDGEAFVYTEELQDLKTYWHQQLRRNSKGFDLNFPIFVMGSWLLNFHLMLVYLLVIGDYPRFFLFTGLKVSVEFLPAIVGAFKFDEKHLIKKFPILWILYPVFYFASQILGSFRIYKWK